MLLVFQSCAIPCLEDLGQSIEFFLLKAIELNDGGRVALDDADFVCFRGATPLCSSDLGCVESKGITAARRLPSKSSLGEPAFAVFLGKVKVYIVEALTRMRNSQLAR